ncbi:MAG: acyl-CoA dehydrogenase, partial [Clostridia bacterium]|nr:acyl-CoA dehydrogenase [Clostridia bacterium]
VNVPRGAEGGRSILCDALVSEQVGYWGNAALACARTFTAHVGYILHRHGNRHIREHYLLPMLAGEKITAQGLTEPGAGSDLAALQTRARRDGERWVVHGQKRFIDGAQTADFIVLAVRTADAEKPHRGISVLVVDTDQPGYRVLEVQSDWHGFRGMGSSWIELAGATAPAENLLGEAGEGWRYLMEELLVERVVMSRAQLGQATRALVIAVNYARSRRTFGRPLSEHQAVQFRVADMATELEAGYLLNTRAARLVDAGLGREAEMEVAMAKLYGTEAAWRVADEAMQVLGGIGYTTKYPVERIVRDLRAARFTAGSSEMMRLLIQRNVFRRLVDPAFRADLVGNEVAGSPVFGAETVTAR